jgi:hypothetical protein
MPAMGIRASLNYIGGTVEVDVHDGRTADLPGWDECGFELVRHESAVTDWEDDSQIEGIHYAELGAFAQELTGADVASVRRHIRRSPQEARKHQDLAPITLVHSDFADSYGDLLRKEDEAVAKARRIVILQFWRNIGPAKMDLPLGFCDARDVPRDDIRPFPVTNYAGGGIDFDALGFEKPRRAGDHHWYAFLELQPDEVIAFRTYDSDRVADGRPYWTPHSAFRDPEVPLGQPSRSSIEARATCLFT